MARKKKNGGGKRSPLTRAINILFEALGLFVASGPAISAVKDNWSTPELIPPVVAYNYLGVQSDGGISVKQAAQGLGQVAAGGVVAALPTIYRKVKSWFRRM